MAQSILYYPTIDIKSEQWLKSAVLYWDEVCSIVPTGSEYVLSDDLRLLQMAEQYRPICPSKMFDTELKAELLEEFIKRIKRRTSYLQNIKKRREHGNHVTVMDPLLYQKIHYKKLPTELLEYLERENCIRVNNDKDWVELRDDFSLIYMKTLAEYVAKFDKEDMIISSDRQWKIDEVFGRTNKIETNEIVSLTLTNCLPVPREDVSVGRLVDFKRRRKAELLELREKIRVLEDDIRTCQSRVQLKDIMNGFSEEWQKALINAKKMFEDDKVDFFLDNLQAFVGGMANGYSLNPIINPSRDIKTAVGVTVGSGILSVSTQYRSYKNKVNERTSNSAFAYLIGAQQNNLLKNCKMI